MRPAVRLLAVFAAIGTVVAAASDAEARSRRYSHHDDWHDRWENRRDARRAGIVAGVVASGVTRAAAQDRVERHYQECLYATGYDYECERQRYWDEQQARRTARRTGVVVGLTAREIVRD